MFVCLFVCVWLFGCLVAVAWLVSSALIPGCAQVRQQFGKPLSQNQHIEFQLAEMAQKIVSSRLMIRNAAQMLDAGHPAARSLCAMAKRHATDNCFEVCNAALQLHGGYGYLMDYPLERFVRDCRVHQILEGRWLGQSAVFTCVPNDAPVDVVLSLLLSCVGTLKRRVCCCARGR